MLHYILISVSLALQITAALYSFSMIGITRHRAAWYLVSAAILMMSLRRLISLSWKFPSDSGGHELIFDSLGLAVSALMFAGIYMLKPVFASIKRSEERLHQLSDEQRILLENSRDFLYRHDINGVFTFISPSVEKITGYPVEEWLTHYRTHITSNEANMKAIEYTEQALSTGREYPPYEVEINHKNGSKVWLEVNEKPVFENGAVAGVVGIARDITERKRAVEELRVSLHRQKSILENIPDMAWIKDAEGRFISVNEAFGNACGRRPEEIAGLTDLDVWPRSLAESYRADDLDVIRSGRRKCVEEPLVDSGGKVLWIETIKTPVSDGKGSIIGTSGIARDITERKLMEVELRKHQDELEELVAKRTEEALKSARLAAIGELASGVAHEINNPINGIINYAEILAGRLEGRVPEKDIAARVIREGERISQIVKSLLSFARERKEAKKVPWTSATFWMKPFRSPRLCLRRTEFRWKGIFLPIFLRYPLHFSRFSRFF